MGNVSLPALLYRNGCIIIMEEIAEMVWVLFSGLSENFPQIAFTQMYFREITEGCLLFH